MCIYLRTPTQPQADRAHQRTLPCPIWPNHHIQTRPREKLHRAVCYKIHQLDPHNGPRLMFPGRCPRHHRLARQRHARLGTILVRESHGRLRHDDCGARRVDGRIETGSFAAVRAGWGGACAFVENARFNFLFIFVFIAPSSNGGCCQRHGCAWVVKNGCGKKILLGTRRDSLQLRSH